jgi:hypothetical protein
MAEPITPDDETFVTAFEMGQIANQSFHHRDHLRLAWVQIRRLGLDSATDRVTSMIRHFAAHHGAADRYNDTMTRFWLRVVGLAIIRHPELRFAALMDAEPHLLDKTLPFRHWSQERIMATEARAHWVEPDLIPMPLR